MTDRPVVSLLARRLRDINDQARAALARLGDAGLAPDDEAELRAQVEGLIAASDEMARGLEEDPPW